MRTPEGLFVADLLQEKALRLETVQPFDGDRLITSPELQKPGLPLAGQLGSLHIERVQVLGSSEVSYIEALSAEMAEARVEAFCAPELPCIVLTRGLAAPDVLAQRCQAEKIPLLRTGLASSDFIQRLSSHLRVRLNPHTNLHGVLVDVFGVGTLLRGKSGIGKSEIALELVMKGHQLVADDVVEVLQVSAQAVVGRGPDLIKYHMEIRGLGIINIRDLFGVVAVRESKRLDLVVELLEWDEDEEYDRLGVDDESCAVLDVKVPQVRLPIRPGRSMTPIIEVAARNQLLKMRGHHSARAFQLRLAEELGARDETSE